MPSSMPWVKLWVAILDSIQVGQLSDALKWRFVQLIVLAGERDQSGLIDLDSNSAAWRLRIDASLLEMDLDKLADIGLVELVEEGIYIPNFEKYNGRPQSEKREAWRKRQAKSRAGVTGDKGVTPPLREDKDKEEEEDEDKDMSDEYSAVYGDLERAFVDATHLPLLLGGPMVHFDALKEMKAAGVTPADVTAAVQFMKKKNYVISSMRSVVNPAIVQMGKRMRVDGTEKPNANLSNEELRDAQEAYESAQSQMKGGK